MKQLFLLLTVLLTLTCACTKQHEDNRMQYGPDFHTLYETYQGYTGYTMSFMCASHNPLGKQITSKDFVVVYIDNHRYELSRITGVVYAIISSPHLPNFSYHRKYHIHL